MRDPLARRNRGDKTVSRSPDHAIPDFHHVRFRSLDSAEELERTERGFRTRAHRKVKREEYRKQKSAWNWLMDDASDSCISQIYGTNSKFRELLDEILDLEDTSVTVGQRILLFRDKTGQNRAMLRLRQVRSQHLDTNLSDSTSLSSAQNQLFLSVYDLLEELGIAYRVLGRRDSSAANGVRSEAKVGEFQESPGCLVLNISPAKQVVL